MTAPTKNQTYHLILADIAMAAAARALCANESIDPADSYVPGYIRDAWLGHPLDGNLRNRLSALASAGVAALKEADEAAILSAARSCGVPIGEELVQDVARHFTGQREAILTYRR